MSSKHFSTFFFLLGSFFRGWKVASAHEVYVLKAEEAAEGFRAQPFNVLGALSNPANLRTFLLIGGIIALGTILVFFLRRTRNAREFGAKLSKLEAEGGVVLRVL